MKYNIGEHGDALEREYHGFINTYFKTYQIVWQLYIGNKGNDKKADIVNYPQNRNTYRQKFSEHTYTILQSLILLHRLIEKDIFKIPTLTSVNQTLDFQDSLLLFFTHLGRIHDNAIHASACLIKSDSSEIEKLLDEFYYQRHLLVHGKLIPIKRNFDKGILIPILGKSNTDQSGWNHKLHDWEDINNIPNQNVNETISEIYWKLLSKIECVFGLYKEKIVEELEANKYTLKFERIKPITTFNSGSSDSCANR